MRATIAALALGSLVACSGGATTSTTGLSGGSSPGSSGGEGTGSSAGTEASTSSGSASGSAGSTSESSAASSTTPVLDMGLVPDLEDPTPAGCEGKIDFLFVINRQSTMEDVYPTLLAGFPGFMATIEEAFADFDYHILVANPAPAWGEPLKCPSIAGKCPIDGGCDAIDEPNYPCWVNYTSGVIAMCDWTLGAGMLFPAGKQATNHPCKLKGGQRYIQKGESDCRAGELLFRPAPPPTRADARRPHPRA